MIHLLSVFPESKTNMGSGGESRRPNITNDLTLLYPFTWCYCAARHVQVLRFIGVVVANFDILAIAFGVA